MTGTQIVYVVGSGHSGSTLLNMMLNAHSEVLGLSEVDVIGRYSATGDQTDTANPLHKPFWGTVRERYEALTQQSFSDIDLECKGYRGWNDDQLAAWQEANRVLFNTVAETSGGHILVDSSKRPERLGLLRSTEGLDFRVIHLIRDGRGVANSVLGKYGKFGKALRSWVEPNLRALRLRKYFEPGHWIQVHYENLATEPVRELSQICDFLEITYEPAMLDFQDAYYVGIDGNYRVITQHDSHIALDERWQRELPPRYRALFALLGGWLNAIYGYSLWASSSS